MKHHSPFFISEQFSVTAYQPLAGSRSQKCSEQTSPALPHSLSIGTVLQAGIPGPLQHEHCRAQADRGACVPCQAQTRRMQLSRVKPEDSDTINTPRARRSLPGQPRRTLFSKCTIQKTNSSPHWNRHQDIRKLQLSQSRKTILSALQREQMAPSKLETIQYVTQVADSAQN